MKYQLELLRLFCIGFILAFLLNASLSCSEKESPTQPEDNNNTEYTENQNMKNLSDSLITAFKSESKTKVISCLNEEYKETYSSILNSTSSSLLSFGEALEKRKLIFANELYAEYEITINENTYSIAYGNGGDDKWQLVRF